MKLGLIMAQLMSADCKFRIWEHREDIEGYVLADMRRYNQMYLHELMEIDIFKIDIAQEFREEIVYDIFVLAY